MKPLMIIVTFMFIITGSLFAEKKTFVREYTYQAGEADSKISSRTIALEQAKRSLLEEIGVYLESKTEVTNFMLTKDEIKCMTAGTVATTIVDEKWDGANYWLKAQMIVDTDEVVKSIEALHDNTDNLQKIADLQKQNDEALKQIEDLKTKIADKNNTDIQQKEKDKTTYNNLVSSIEKRSFTKDLALLLASKKFKEAYKRSDDILATDPANIEALFIRGSASIELDKYDQAKKDFEKIKTLANADKITLSLVNQGYGKMMMKDGNYKEAVKLFNEAVAANPKMIFLLYNRAEANYKLGNYKESLTDIEIFVRTKRRSADGFYLKGLIAEKLKLKFKMRQAMEQAAKLGHPEAKNWVKKNKSNADIGSTPDER